MLWPSIEFVIYLGLTLAPGLSPRATLTLLSCLVSHFSFSHRRDKFKFFFQQKMAPYLSSQLSVALFLVRVRWPVAYFLFLLSFPFSIFQICGNDNWSTLNTLDSTIPSLVVSASQDADGYAISRQNNLELHLGCHTCWLSYFTLVYLWCKRTGGRADGHVITKISRMGRLPHFRRYGATLARVELRYDLVLNNILKLLKKKSKVSSFLMSDNF